MREWDLFISHASEDKADVVLPLAEALRRAGLRVWLDRQEIRIGDSLREKIDEGLANSHFGVVVFSPSFLGKGWPKRELAGLFALEEVAGRKVILPIWHKVDKAAVSSYSPILADRVAGSTSNGIEQLAAELIGAIFDPSNGAAAQLSPTPSRLLIDLLDRDPSREDLIGFLSAHPRMVTNAIGHATPQAWSTALGPYMVDLRATDVQHTTAEVSYHLIQFGPVMSGVMDGSEPSDLVRQNVEQLRNVRRWIMGNLRLARQDAPDINAQFNGIVMAGRRQMLRPDQQEALRRYHDELVGIKVRTYDWLVDGQRSA